MAHKASRTHFAFCIKNDDYAASLEVRKGYLFIPDDQAAKHQMLRIIDESGEDYLYPAGYFVLIEMPAAAERAFVLTP
jgi:hypothetical protein